MKIFYVLIAALTLACSENSFAGNSTLVVPFAGVSFTTSVRNYDSLFSPVSRPAKVCACQILQVESNNEKNKTVAVFAEHTNTGDLSSNFNLAMSVIEKEKKHLKQHFYSKIKVVESKSDAIDCEILYRNYKARYAEISMDILDADVLNNIFLSKK